MVKRVTNKELAVSINDLAAMLSNVQQYMHKNFEYMHETFGEFRQEFKYVHERIDLLEKRLVSEIRGVDDLDYRVQELESIVLPRS